MTPSQSTALLSDTTREPVAVVGQDFTLLWAGSGPIAPLVQRHGLTVGSKLYAEPPATAPAAATLRGMEKEGPASVIVTDAGWAQLWVHGVHIQSGYGQGAKECCDKLAARINSAAQATPHTDHPAPFARGSWQHAVDDQLVGYGKTSEEFASPQEAVKWLLHVHGDAAITCAMTASASVQATEHTGHHGANDAS